MVQRRGGRKTLRRRLSALVGVALIGGLSACDGLLDVELPGSVEADDLENPALATTLVNSALGQFECAYTNYIASTAVLADELINSSLWAAINHWGWRGLGLQTINGICPSTRGSDQLGAYSPLQQARYLAEDGYRLIEEFDEAAVPNREEMLGLLSSYAGYSISLLGEGYCEMALDESPLMQPQEVIAIAEERFTTAIGHARAAGNTELELMALVGRARARLNLGKLEEAAQDAEQIPEGFVWYAEYSTVHPRRENRVYDINRRNRYLSVQPNGYLGLEVDGVPDIRVSVTDPGLFGHDGITQHYYQDKYPNADSPIPIASWEEAQLIIAEARPAEAEAAINRLRDSQGLPPYTPSGDHLADVLEERRRQLFLEGHRLNDMLRHDLPFPTGLDHKGHDYGPITCMPLPESEKRGNPNIDT